ncbi:MAG: cysteine--tRNA ligase [Acidimicrobiia bacterium]|nr:cysteine--tRNA ligase [Acidimicrobiia bacterium]
MQVFNTLGRELQDLITRDEGRVGMYLCGPTVQAAPHIGHGRGPVIFDVLRRYLVWQGLDVTFVSNVTDVNDTIFERAAERGVDWTEVVSESSRLFLDAYRKLGILDPDIRPRVTDHMDEIIELIGDLVDNGSAYEANGDVYFRVRDFDGYGKLSGRNIDELISGSRIEPEASKEDPLDFALWKAVKPGEPSWSSPWGDGRPGWHIECSAMATRYLGPSFDIHGGGIDLVFPHHENEIAQSEAATDVPFSRYWLHNGFINLAGEKMSKSVGNVVDLNQTLEDHEPLAVRLFYLRSHYRKPVDFTPENLADAEATLERLWSFRRRIDDPAESAEPDQEALAAFRRAMDNDLDTAGALSVAFEIVKQGNVALDAGHHPGPAVAAFDQVMHVLGLTEPRADVSDIESELRSLAAKVGSAVDGDLIDGLIAKRQQARSEKDFETSDGIRDALDALGIRLEDGADGTRWHRQ